MPTLIRFIIICAVLAGLLYGGAYALAVFFEPEPKEIITPVRNVKPRT